MNMAARLTVSARAWASSRSRKVHSKKLLVSNAPTIVAAASKPTAWELRICKRIQGPKENKKRPPARRVGKTTVAEGV